MKKNLAFLLILTASLMSCSPETEEDIPVDDKPEIYALYSMNGLGDNSVNDFVYIAMRYLQYEPMEGYQFDFKFNSSTPLDMAEAEAVCSDWMDEDVEDGKQRLLILADPSYDILLDKHPEWQNNTNSDILLINSDRTDLNVYTMFVSLYGICYEAALLASEWCNLSPGWGMADKRFQPEKIAVVCANPHDHYIMEGRIGIMDAITDADGPETDIFYLSEKARDGYNDVDSMYVLSYNLDQQNYGFAFPLCGGSQVGMLSYTRQSSYYGTFNVCGMEYEWNNYSNAVSYSAIARIYNGLLFFMKDWFENTTDELHSTLYMDSEIFNLWMTEGYVSYFTQTLGIDLEDIHARAIEAELKHKQNKQ